MEGKSAAILKTIWGKRQDGKWAIRDLKSLTLNPKEGQEGDYFAIKRDVELMTLSPSGMSTAEVFRSFGTTDFLMKQSIVPIAARVHNEPVVRIIGTGFFISCTGFLMTACHVVLDPEESGYGRFKREGNRLWVLDGLEMGILLRISPATGLDAVAFLPFESSWYWGDWKSSPLFHERDRFDMLTDIAICKVQAVWPHGEGHQPLTLSLKPFKKNEQAVVIGYAEMPDMLISVNGDGIKDELFVSMGPVKDVFLDNHLSREVPTPGPCFDFGAKVPGKMSGAPVFGAEGAVVRGVVSRSFSGERHAYGAMIGPARHLPLGDNISLSTLMKGGKEGIPDIQGEGL
jgi:hypothetical protein